MTSIPFEELSSCDGLTVIPVEDPRFMEALTSRSFKTNLPSDKELYYPEAIFIATIVSAVQAAVKFCNQHNLCVSPRSGGHSWYSIWMQGKNSIILDIGELNNVEFDMGTQTIYAGPGATSINTKISKEYFFPSGHCSTVPLGGFVLGGGFGIGFPKYGMACSLVKGVEVVLSSGEIRTVRETDTDEVALAIMDLVRGSYHHFPAVITKYELGAVNAPKCVLPQSYIFDVKDWKLAVKYGRDIMHRGDSDASSIETTIVFCHAPPHITEETGIRTMVVLSLMIWSGDDETVTRALLDKYTKNITGTLLPTKSEQPLTAHTVAKDVYSNLYPESRYLTNAYCGDESFLGLTDEAVFDVLKPLAESWMSDENVLPGPHSHSLFVLLHKNMLEVNGCDLACGFVPSFEVMSYAIYDDEESDEKNWTILEQAMEGVAKSTSTYTASVEGNVRDGKSAFLKKDWENLSNKLKLLDPQGIFQKKVVRVEHRSLRRLEN